MKRALEQRMKSLRIEAALPIDGTPTPAALEWALAIARSGPLATSRDRNKALAILCATLGAE